MKELAKNLFIVPVSLLLALSLLFTACSQKPQQPAADIGSPFTGEISFPKGAPALNREAKLIYVLNATHVHLNDIDVEIRLPEGLELVSGNLTWSGSIPKGEQRTVIDAIVRAVKTGNWIIENRRHIDLSKQIGGVSIGADWYPAIYVAISENEAQWGIYPPWHKSGGDVPVRQVGGEPSPPYTLELSFPKGAPALNQVAELRGVVKNKNVEMIDANIRVILPQGFELVSGNITWSASSLPFGDTEVINAQIRAIKTGNWTIEARVTAAKSDLSFPEGGARYPIYVSVQENSAQWGEVPFWVTVGPVPVRTVPPSPPAANP